MHRLISMDTSGLEALEQLHRVLKRRGIALVLANVNEQPLSLIRRSGFEAVIGADAIVPNVAEAVDSSRRRSRAARARPRRSQRYQNGLALRSAASARAQRAMAVVALVRQPAQREHRHRVVRPPRPRTACAPRTRR